MNLVSLLLLPAVISLRNNSGARFSIAGVCLVVLIVAIAFSKRSTGSMGEEGLPAVSYEAAAVDGSPADILRAQAAGGRGGPSMGGGASVAVAPTTGVIGAIDTVIENAGGDATLIRALQARREELSGAP